jgi:DNA polymerase III subunit alpha
MNNYYTPLHVHSHYSLLDGLSKPKQISARCEKIGTKACAITDHGTIAGAVQIYKELKSKNIKPILGCELYICNDKADIKTPENLHLSHLLLLAKNYKGWQTLIKIVSESNRPDFFYKKPRLDLDTLMSMLDGNIIGMAGHLGSTLAELLETASDISYAGREWIAKVKDGFGADNFILESQLIDRDYNPKQIELTEHIRRISKLTKTMIVCTPDAHYAESEDAVDQRILLCNNLKVILTDINRKLLNNDNVPMSCFFKSDKYHIPSFEEMKELHTEEEIENTNIIADICEDYSITSKPMLPEYKCPDGYNPDEYLRQLCRNGWKEKIASTIPKQSQNEYVERIKYELSVLQGAGLSSYFLIVQDIVDYVKRNQWLPGPGRGSAAGCLVSYLIGITSIDPIKYNLLFDRFYNSGRNTKDHISMPDIDVDVPINKRENVVEYIKNIYGHDKVSQMITFNTMKGRGALKEVLRVYGNMSFDEMNNITKSIPDEAKIADELQEMKDETGEASIIRWALENNVDKLKEWCYILEDDSLGGPLAKRFEQAIRLEGTKSNQSKHAAGVVISQTKLSEICPMIYDTKNQQQIAGMEMQDLESLGVIKFDILGIAMLDKIMNISEILQTEGVDDVNRSFF